MYENKKFVYADNAATTPVDESVLSAMLPYLKDTWGNPSSAYSIGREASSAVSDARGRIASLLSCKPNEIFFTSSGSEADNWAIKGAASSAKNKGKHIVTTAMEHHAVLNAMKSLAREGFEITYVSPDKNGIISPSDIENAMREDTVLVCVMYANNEIGTLQPIKEIAEVAHRHGALMFTDAVQAVGHLDINVKDLGVDMLSFSGHKINAPKGIGALYINTGTRVHTLIDGGGQERGRRGGTENVPYIVGLAKALELAYSRLDSEKRVLALRERLVSGILEKIPYSFLNGDRERRLAGNANITFEYVEGESLLMFMDMCGICCSTGSACNSASLEPSHVLLSIGVPAEKAHGSLRFTLSHENTEQDVDYILEKLPAIVQRLRDMSPLYSSGMERVK